MTLGEVRDGGGFWRKLDHKLLYAVLPPSFTNVQVRLQKLLIQGSVFELAPKSATILKKKSSFSCSFF
jgi:hypothetical protein